MRRISAMVLVVVTVFLLIGGIIFITTDRQTASADIKPYHATAAAEKTERVLKRNLAAVNAGDVNAYLQTIVPAQRAKTKAAVQQGLTKRQATVKLRSFTVQKQEKQQLVAKIDELQQTRGQTGQQVLEANVEFVQQQGVWYIKKMVVYNAVKNG